MERALPKRNFPNIFVNEMENAQSILQKKKSAQYGRVKVSTHEGTSPCNKPRGQVDPFV